MGYTTVGALRRADQLYYEQVSERQTLEYGLAFHAPEFPDAIGDNAFREVLVQNADAMPAALSEVHAFYSAQGLNCRRWVPCADQDCSILEPHLLEKGFAPSRYAAMCLESWRERSTEETVRVLPARAMRKAFRSLGVEGENMELAERRLDYAQYDMYVAMRGGRGVGRCGLFQAGEVAEVRDLYVLPDCRRQGVGSALMREVTALARRLMMKNLVARVQHDAAAAGAFLGTWGFVNDGELIEFDLASD